jgi:hypothetical protein
MEHTVDTERSFAFFVYPFLWGAGSEGQPSLATLAGQVDQACMGDKKLWEPYQFPEDDLMPRVGRFLDASKADSQPTVAAWKLHDGMKEALGLDQGANCFLSFGNRDIPFRLGQVGKGQFALQLLLFSSGVGLATACASPKSDALADRLDFLHAFRFFAGREKVHVRVEKRTGIDATTRQPLNRARVAQAICLPNHSQWHLRSSPWL